MQCRKKMTKQRDQQRQEKVSGQVQRGVLPAFSSHSRGSRPYHLEAHPLLRAGALAFRRHGMGWKESCARVPGR